MRPIDNLFPRILKHAPAAPEPLLYGEVRQAAREFCKRSRLWREHVTMTITNPEKQAFDPIDQARIQEISTARLNGFDLTPKTLSWLDNEFNDWESMEGPARFFTQLTPDTITIVPKQIGTLVMRCVLIPTDNALDLPDFLIEDYAEEIAKGAAGRVLVTPDVDYANPTLGSALVMEFQSMLDGIDRQGQRGRQRAPLRTRGSYF